ncbi:MAG TPA: malto-oligosyltrehalose synthase [Terriglobales bacterium]|nr:malto-oligosyltrehalose synthase [Terriglobales bacterium]
MTRIPISTYRLQFNRRFTFAQAAEIVPYLAALGISHCYASPYLRARPGSMHGYDIIDHHNLNPEIGSSEDYERFVSALHHHGMGQILDIVPNHMGVMGADNAWWLDVLENGEASNYAEFFDIDWEPLKDELQGKVLVPVLGDQYGTILERGDLKLTFDESKGEFSIFYFQHRFPVNPKEYPRILIPAADRLAQRVDPQNENLLELQSLIAAFGHLPGREEKQPEKRAERARDKEIHKRRLATLAERSHEIVQLIHETVHSINGVPGETGTFEQLHELIKAQAFRLAYWRVAADDINYRRFFDVNDLAALRQENPQVFTETHDFVEQLLREGKVDGLRIDHPDGLYNPREYFCRLQCGLEAVASGQVCSAKPRYVIAEKILTDDEQLARDWPIHGTTGYEFATLVNGLFVDPGAEEALDRTYEEFIGEHVDFRQLVYECKKLVMDRSLNSELNVLANHLSRIALSDRHTCDFTVKSLRDALTEIIACFPVYRTYVAERGVSETDRQYIDEAVECAKLSSAAADLSVFDFIRDILLTRQAEGHTSYYQRSVVHFAMRFQQYTSALMAKGLEDTSFYRYNRLVSLNDVGGDPTRFGITAEEFHAEMQQRAARWPHSMLSGSTHDSKRSEDVRARINVLSEMPDEWTAQVFRWRELNQKFKVRESSGASFASEVPSANDEYLFYQTLIGAWPLAQGSDRDPESLVQRIADYMIKALREAKDRTSWANTNTAYEEGVSHFVKAVICSEEFRADFLPFQRKVAYFGLLNSLGQMLIRLTVPGVPDVYQGNEMWDFSLVDPDNRRAVDYAARRRLLQQIQEMASSESQLGDVVRNLTVNLEDGCIKMYVLWQALKLRQQIPEVFQEGTYNPLRVAGAKANHVVAFLRKSSRAAVLVVVPRLSSQLTCSELRLPLGQQVWRDCDIELQDMVGSEWFNMFTGERHKTSGERMSVSEILRSFPLGLFSSELPQIS